MPIAEPPLPEAVVFDVGGVLIDWNPRHLYRRLFDDEEEMERFLAEVCSPAWNLLLDAGLPFQEGVGALKSRFPQHARLIHAYDEQWQEMVVGALEDTVAVLRDVIEAGWPVYALTNFSAEKFALERQRWPFLNWFRGVVVSGEVGVVKPDPAIYRHLTSGFGLVAERCLFIDDQPANVAGARAVGMQAVRFVGADALRAELSARGVLTDGVDASAAGS